jgi:nicotinamidase-related amidase
MRNVLVLIDIQQEYTTVGRPYYLKGIEPSLANCRQLLTHARNSNWDICHVQHSNGEDAPKFAPNTSYFDFVAGFEPKADELHVIKRDFSCYSSVEFSDYLAQVTQSPDYKIYIIGYNTVMCCLSTLEEARRRGKNMYFVEDAALAKSIEDKSEHEMHKIMLGIYKAKGLATLVTTANLLATIA